MLRISLAIAAAFLATAVHAQQTLKIGMVLTSVTLPQVMETFGNWAATKGGVKQAYTMVTDYGPGIDSEQAFQNAFKAAGGTIAGSVRFPVANPDFSAYVQRAKDVGPQA